MPRGARKRFHFLRTELIALYVDEQLSASEIAKRFGCSDQTISKTMKAMGIAMRPGGNTLGKPIGRRFHLPVEEIKALYVDHLWSTDRLAERYGCSTPTVTDRLREAGVTIRASNDTKRGAPSPNRHVINEAAAVYAYVHRPTMSITEIAASLGCHANAVNRALDKYGTPRKTLSQVIAGKRNGSANPNWRDDLTDEERATRRDMAAQAKWRMQVWQRDGFACVKCDDATGGNLNAHHLESHNSRRDIRWEINNGVTLCEPCHLAFHKRFGYGSNTASQFTEYMNVERIAA